MAKKEKEVNPLWGGRFTSGSDKLAQSFSASIDIDKRLFEADIKGSIAYADILRKAKLISANELSKIKKGLNKILNEIQQDKFNWDPALEDVHMNIESRLVKIAGAAAKKIHTGRSRNDQVATDLRLFLMDKIDDLSKLLTVLQQSILQKAEGNSETIMPGFTHLQIAQPVTFGHHLMAWYEMLSRDYSRLQDTKERMSVMPLGSAALAGSRFEVDREKLAKRLDFNSTSNNSMDAVSDRDFVVEFTANSSILGVHLSRICEELVIWSSSQFNYIQLSEEFCTGSSIMPHKKNPDMAELIRGGSSKTIASLMGLLSLMKNQPLSYNRDMQEDKEFIFSASDYCTSSLELFSHMISEMIVNTERMKADCNIGQITATDLADYLVRNHSMPFRKAYQKTAAIVNLAEKKKKKLDELSIEELKKIEPKLTNDVLKVFDLKNSVNSKKSYGGTSFDNIKKMIIKYKKH